MLTTKRKIVTSRKPRPSKKTTISAVYGITHGLGAKPTPATTRFGVLIDFSRVKEFTATTDLGLKVRMVATKPGVFVLKEIGP